MKRRIRAALFFGLAAAAGLMGASITSGYRDGALAEFGPLRPVVVAAKPLAEGRTLTPALARRRLTIVRVPDRFVPDGAAVVPEHLIGLRPRGDLPAGTYLGASLFRSPDRGVTARPHLAGGRQPVEIMVAGASALSAAGPVKQVDVIVTSEPTASSVTARAYVAASAVPLLSLSPPRRDGEPATAVLGLRRSQALRLIRAESYARGIRLVPSFNR